MGIWDGFEGYRDPTEEEALDLLRGSSVVLDTNVLIDLYSIPESARNLALDALEFLRERLFVPHQVMREFWRNRQAAIANAPLQNQPLGDVRNELLAIVNSLRPGRGHTDELDAIRNQINTTLDDLSSQIDDARGRPLDVKKILEDNTTDPVLQRLDTILADKIGPGLSAEEDEVVKRGLERFATKTPPGYMDGKEKSEQLPERGTGDYILWEQTLRFVEGLPEPRSFIIVTNDSKEDWRVVLTQPKKQVLGVRPELVAEALERAQARFVLLQPRDFYRLMDKIRSVDADASLSLASALDTVSENRTQDAESWTPAAYRHLLSHLRRDGYEAQADVIVQAATTGGLARRADIYRIAGYSDDRSLRRFSIPAQRAANSLVDSGILPEGAPFPLEAVYEGPGKTIGYEVPEEFLRFAISEPPLEVHDDSWLTAAIEVARGEPDRIWSAPELVASIVSTGLCEMDTRDRPTASLRVDLRTRGAEHFEQIGSGFRLRELA